MINQGRDSNKLILKVLEKLTTKRLARKVLEMSKVENKNINELSKKDINIIIEYLVNFTIVIDRVQSKEKSFVNTGGIITKGLNPKSMESKNVEGLYFIGEVVDVHGPIGGFNITIALSTGRKCGNHIMESLNKEVYDD